MELSPNLKKLYTKEHLSANDAQLRAQFIAWGPVIFQTTRIMLKYGILEMLRDSEKGLTRAEIDKIISESRLTGIAKEQTEAYVKEVRKVLSENSESLKNKVNTQINV